MEHDDQTRVDGDTAFEIVKIDLEAGETTVVIKNGIIGPISNQLRGTSTHRKASSILRKLGYVLGDCGDMQYGKEDFDIEETDIDPETVVGEFKARPKPVAS